jgi:CCR4-NOT transcription complex subunit 1
VCFDAYLHVIFLLAIQQLQSKTPHAQSPTNTVPLAMFFVGAALDIFQALIADLDTEGRYLFLNAVANQLRYPNTHTHYFSFILLYLFAESNQVRNVLFTISLGCICLACF